jgi:hypothetical protein
MANKIVSNRKATALLAGIAVAAMCVSTAVSAANHGGGGPHGGGGGVHAGGFGGFHGGGFHGGLGGLHGSAAHAFGTRGFTSNGLSSHGVAAHDVHTSAADGLAHRQVAAGHFHGLYNRAGFNRNAFGYRHGWDRWGGRFARAGWGWGWGAWAGPVFWPFLYGDILSFAFWPYDYYDPFWDFGPDFVLDSVFATGPYLGGGYGYAGAPEIYYGTTRANEAELAQADAAAAQSCSGLAPDVNDLPIAQIRKQVHPTGDQEAALDDLNAASSKANDIVKASCPSEPPLTPIARLDAAQKRLEAMIEAVQTIRPAVAKFYDSLSDEQKQRFETIGKSGKAVPAEGSSAATDVAAQCGQQANDLTKRPMQRIEQVIEPKAQQQSDFEALKKASDKAAEELQASCPTQMSDNPVARLDSVDKRLNAMVEAMKTIRPKLAAFYDSLSDEQKARFNTMHPPKNTAAQTQQQGRD